MRTILLPDRLNFYPSSIKIPTDEQPAHCEATEEVVEELGTAMMPPVKDCLVLADHLAPDVCAELKDRLGEVIPYTWYSEENFNKIHGWCLAAATATGQSRDFFIAVIVDMYHYDRALRGATENKKPRPRPRGKIKQFVTRKSTTYELVVKPLAWSRDVPLDAVDAVGQFVRTTPPDSFWIADYVYSTKHNDPIIYASFGPWEVEVARWD